MKKTILILAALSASVTSHAWCSVCIAHALGAMLHGIGAQTMAGGHGVVGVSCFTFSKSTAADDNGVPSREFYQTNLEASYGICGNLMASISVPFVSKSIALANSPGNSSSGLGDSSIGLTYQLPTSTSGKILTAFRADIKLPTGDNSLKDATGARRDEHEQLGTGTTDGAFGILLSMEDPHITGNMWYAGLRYRTNGTNKFDYKYGNVYFYNFGYSAKVGKADNASFEFVGRIASKDRDAGVLDPNTGGHVLYASLSYVHDFGSIGALTASIQVPIIQSLCGDQTERPVLSIAASRRF